MIKDCNHLLKRVYICSPLTTCIILLKLLYNVTSDCSLIHDKFIKMDYYLLKYKRGIDQFIYEVIKDYKLYTIEDKFCSYQTILDEQDYVLIV